MICCECTRYTLRAGGEGRDRACGCAAGNPGGRVTLGGNGRVTAGRSAAVRRRDCLGLSGFIYVSGRAVGVVRLGLGGCGIRAGFWLWIAAVVTPVVSVVVRTIVMS